MIHVAVIFHRLGPYHWARLNAAAVRLRVAAVELSAHTREYGWNRIEKAGNFARFTIFTKRDSRTAYKVQVIKRVFSVLNHLQPDAVAVPGWSDIGALAALLWANRNGKVTVLMSESQAGDAKRAWWKEFIKKRVIALADTGLVGGQAHAAYLAALGMLEQRICFGYDVVDNNHFATGAERARFRAAEYRKEMDLPENYFVASCRFIPKKNLIGLIRAYAAYKPMAGAAAWKLVLLGNGPLEGEIRYRVRQLGMDDQILMPGFKQYDELPVYYGLARAFIHPSTTEQWGLVVNEAMACGLPVFVSDRCGCARDLVKNAANGYIFNPDDVPKLAHLLLSISSGQFDLAAMGQASRRIITGWAPESFGTGLYDAVTMAMQLRKKSNDRVPPVCMRAQLHR